MRFHLVDRIEAYEASRSVRARKLTSQSEAYWQVRGGELMMPPPLVLESLCQAGAWLVVLSTAGRKRAALAAVGSVEFYRPVEPAQSLLLEATVDVMSDEMAVLSGRVTVDDRLVLRADDIMCVLVDAAILDDPEDVDRIARRLTGRDGT